MNRVLLALGVAVALTAAGAAPAYAAPQFAVWLDGDTDPVGQTNGILSSLDNAFGAGDYTLVSTANLETAGFLNAYQAVVVSRDDSNFGTSLSAAAAANVAAYVGSGANQGGVAILTNDAADNLYGATGGDPYDNNINQLFVNSAKYAAASGHGYIGEFNGAVMAMDSNDAGFAALGLFQGNASALGGYGPEFSYGVGPIGANNPIDAGVTFPFTDADNTTFLTQITGEKASNVVDVYTSTDYINGDPAVMANSFVISGGMPSAAPEPETWALMIAGVAIAGGMLRHERRRRATIDPAV